MIMVVFLNVLEYCGRAYAGMKVEDISLWLAAPKLGLRDEYGHLKTGAGCIQAMG